MIQKIRVSVKTDHVEVGTVPEQPIPRMHSPVFQPTILALYLFPVFEVLSIEYV